MERKVVKQGPATLMVSLPAIWARENKIIAGDTLNTSMQGNQIFFSKTKNSPLKKNVTINIDSYNTYVSLSRLLTVLYKTGYNQINLTYSRPKENILSKRKKKLTIRSAIRIIIDRFIGAEIISQTSNRTEIECLEIKENPNLDKIAKRIHFLLKETINEMMESIGPKYNHFNETIFEHHDSITKFINYYLRTLYNSKKKEEEKKFAFAFYTIIERLVDQLRHISYSIDKNKCTPRVKKYLEEIFTSFLAHFKYLNQNELIPEEWVNKRYKIKEDIKKEKLTLKEYPILTEAILFLDSLNVFSEYIIARNLDKLGDSKKTLEKNKKNF